MHDARNARKQQKASFQHDFSSRLIWRLRGIKCEKWGPFGDFIKQNTLRVSKLHGGKGQKGVLFEYDFIPAKIQIQD